ncbi:NUDIX domain-containing protein [Candidatus Pacearchaeota archaeon]|nr:NUDIX domain-containing protein [Candidatus Pacearchaeota archaeon]
MNQERQTMRSAGAIVFIIRDNQILYLLLKHIKTGIHWGFPKGRMEENESEKDTALREVEEETGLTGLTFLDGFRNNEEYSFERKSDRVMIDKTVTYFLLEANSKEAKVSEEHSEYIWVTFEEAFAKLKQESPKKLLKIADDRIKFSKL